MKLKQWSSSSSTSYTNFVLYPRRQIKATVAAFVKNDGINGNVLDDTDANLNVHDTVHIMWSLVSFSTTVTD